MSVDAPRHRPLLASDVWRSLIATGVGALIGLVLLIALVATGVLGARDSDVLGFQVGYLGWSIGIAALVLVTLIVFLPASADDLVSWLRATTPCSVPRRVVWAVFGGGAVPWAIGVSFTTLGALFAILGSGPLRSARSVVVTGAVMAVLAFTEIIVAFAVRYAREDATRGGLLFPGDDRPRFSSYLYLSVQVTVTFSPSDVEIRSAHARGLVAVHAIVAFAFNAVVVAMLVSTILAVGGAGG